MNKAEDRKLLDLADASERLTTSLVEYIRMGSDVTKQRIALLDRMLLLSIGSIAFSVSAMASLHSHLHAGQEVVGLWELKASWVFFLFGTLIAVSATRASLTAQDLRQNAIALSAMGVQFPLYRAKVHRAGLPVGEVDRAKEASEAEAAAAMLVNAEAADQSSNRLLNLAQLANILAVLLLVTFAWSNTALL